MLYAICNPTAGAGRGEKIGRQVEAVLQERKIPYLLKFTQSPGHATELAREALKEKAETVIAIGGDGTLSEVARGLAGGDSALGIIPAGTGNDFVKTLGLPRAPMEALDFILSHPAQKTDVGEMNGRFFLNEIGTGFDVSVLDYAGKAKKYCRGLLPYLYGVIQTVFRFHSIPITYTLDHGETITRNAFVIGVANGGVIGGGICIAPDARADDGLFDVVVVDEVKKSKFLSRLIHLMKGKILTFPETHFCRVKEIEFSAPHMRVNVDGEIVSADHVSARLLPGALMIHR